MIKSLFKWTLLASFVGFLTGVSSWAFFKSIAESIELRKSYPWIILFLPFVGALVAWGYSRYGKEIDAGSNLILDEIHAPKRHVAFRMVPMIFISSVLSHLFGASVGREGAAVQIGAGISDQFSRFMGSYFDNRRIVLMSGMSAGFAAIFGAPIAGAVFGMEVLMIGAISYEALFPCLISAIVGFGTAQWLGISYFHQEGINIPGLSLSSLFYSAIAGIVFGVVARFFLFTLHWIKINLSKKLPNPVYRPLFGGTIIVLFFFMTNSDRYLSLGEEVINASFTQLIYPWDFLGKIFTTAISVGSGFKGGEVMSLFYIGSTLGNALGFILPLPISFVSALGFVAVFAGAANTPIAAIFLAINLFGSQIGIYAAIAIVMSYLFSGQNGLYHSQKKSIHQKL
ncbi:MAG: chloride channel protein [Bacteriovorax sp.]|jgi:H+/Cl- antiporter ClcA|nr:chloride channel protein [Bacteriovorax sp.]